MAGKVALEGIWLDEGGVTAWLLSEQCLLVGWKGGCCKPVAPMTSVLKGHTVWRDLQANVIQLQLQGRAILEWGLGKDSQGRWIECGGE